MGAQMTRTPDGYRVTCEDHALNRTVWTSAHATNIVQLHDRKDHADDPDDGVVSVNLTEAAGLVIALDADPSLTVEARAALSVWSLLTGLDDEEAFTYAQQIAETSPDVTAHVSPF